MKTSLSPFAPENLVSRDGFGCPVPRQPAHLHTQAESGATHKGFLPSSSAASIYLFKPPYASGSVPSSSGHAIAYRWRSLPRVRRHRTGKPQGNSERVLPWQVSIDQLICASLFPHPLSEGVGGGRAVGLSRFHMGNTYEQLDHPPLPFVLLIHLFTDPSSPPSGHSWKPDIVFSQSYVWTLTSIPNPRPPFHGIHSM